MIVSILYENQKTFTVFEILGSDGIQVIEKITLNGIDLVVNIDYTIEYPIASVAVISGLIPFLKTTDDLDITFYAENGTTVVDSLNNIPINFNYNYIEIDGDVNNGIDSSDTTDKSAEMSTPLIIRGCQEVNVNGHLLHIANIGAISDGESAPILFNGVAVTGSDFDKSTHPALLPLDFDVSGVLTEVAGNSLIEFSSIPKTAPFNIETTRNRNDEGGIDAFLLDGIGFRKISFADPVWVDITGNNNIITPTPPISAVFKVEITSTHYNIICDSVTLVSYPKNVIYTSDKGTITPSGSQDYLTEVNFNPDSYGAGEIRATFAGVSARQAINVIIPRQPDFGGTSFGNVCPVENFNLNSLTDSNLESGVGLQTLFFTDVDHNNPVINSNITAAGIHTFYAFQYDSSTDCWSTSRQITITITSCALPDPTIVTNWEGITTCGSYEITPEIINNYPNPTYQWFRNGIELVADTLNYTATQSGNYTLHIYNTGTSDHYSKSGNITITPLLVFTQNLPVSPTTAPASFTIAVDDPGRVTNITWQHKETSESEWVTVLSNPTAYSYTPSANGYYIVFVTYDCGELYSSISHVWVRSINDDYVTLRNTNIIGNVSANDYGCDDPDNPQLRTFYRILTDTISPINSGEIINFNETTGEFTFQPNFNFVGVVTFDYEIYCTLEPVNNDPELAFTKDQARVTMTFTCDGVEDFQIEYDQIAYIGGKTCYESYKIVNIFPENAPYEEVIVETEGVEIYQPYDDTTKRIIGKITRHRSVIVRFTIISCGVAIVREAIQKVSLKPCCN